MGTPEHFSDTDLEHLLEGRRGAHGLSRLLAAASSPGAAGELDGWDAAVAAFSAAGPGPDAATPRRKSMIKSVLAKLVAAKAAALVAGTAAMGGVALAASTGTLPAPLQSAAHALGAPAAHSAHDSTTTQGSTGTAPQAEPTETTTEPTTEPTDAPAAPSTDAPNPSLVGLCHAWSEGEHGASAANPAFSVLVTAAGGSSGVTAYCTTLLASTAPHADGTPEATDSKDTPDNPDAEHSNPAEPSHTRDATSGDHQDGQGSGEHSSAPEPQHSETPDAPETHSPEPTQSSGGGHDSGSQDSGSGGSSGDN